MQFAESVSVVRLAAPRTCFLCMTFLRRFRIEFMQVSTVQLSSEHRFLATSFCGNVQHQHRLPSINIMIRLINVMGKNVTWFYCRLKSLYCNHFRRSREGFLLVPNLNRFRRISEYRPMWGTTAEFHTNMVEIARGFTKQRQCVLFLPLCQVADMPTRRVSCRCNRLQPFTNLSRRRSLFRFRYFRQ